MLPPLVPIAVRRQPILFAPESSHARLLERGLDLLIGVSRNFSVPHDFTVRGLPNDSVAADHNHLQGSKMRLKAAMVGCCALGLAMPTFLQAQSMSKNPPSKATGAMADSQQTMPSHDSSMKRPSKSMMSTDKAKSPAAMNKAKSPAPMGDKKKSAMDSGMTKPAMKADTASRMKKPLR